VFAALADDLDYGNCPGSKISLGDQEIWLHTNADVKSWLQACHDELFGEEVPEPPRRCPVHGIPDCSPLFNGCSRLQLRLP